MKISGFTMVKNATKLYYPIKQAIESILPIVDEFVVALGDCDPDDTTEQEIRSIGSDKVKIIPTEWDTVKYPNGTENAHQSNLAKKACSGDWLFYLQADEVIHERYHETIVQQCHAHLDNPEVEGFLFNYKHFWGDYDHYQLNHGWYPKEIRIVRNTPDIYSWESAQSFRRIPDFDEKNYRQQEGTFKLKVKQLEAEVYHYGWVRPPKYMQKKRVALDSIHKTAAVAEKAHEHIDVFDYGPLRLATRFTETHPAVMQEWIKKFDWGDILYKKGPIPKNRKRFKHERLKYRLLTFIEQRFLGGEMIMGFKNYELV